MIVLVGMVEEAVNYEIILTVVRISLLFFLFSVLKLWDTWIDRIDNCLKST